MIGRHRSRGSALLISLWALLLLSASIFAWVKYLDREIDSARQANLALEARALAHSGVVMALNPKVKQQSPLLKASLGPERGYDVAMVGEGGKLNLNYLLIGEQPAHIALLKGHFARRGIPFAETARMVDCMLDWIDADNLKHLNGTEDEGDYRPPNRDMLLSLDEIPRIRGTEPLVSQPGWRDDFTLYSNPGKIDLQAASAELLALLPGVGEARALRFVQIRQGPDKLDGTRDDAPIKDLSQALSYLGVKGDQQVKALEPLVSWQDGMVHILSIGRAGKLDRQVEVVAQKGGGNPQILLWKEN
jgi:type II secretory pathway component PulK